MPMHPDETQRQRTDPIPMGSQPPTDRLPPLGDEPVGANDRVDPLAPGPAAPVEPAAQEAPVDRDGRPYDMPPLDVEPDGRRDPEFDEPRYADDEPEYPTPAMPVAEAEMVVAPQETAVDRDEDSGAVLFGDDEVERFRARWRELQADFVDDPKEAVRGADQLVGEVVRALTDIFAQHKNELEEHWRGEGAGETEELRVALRRYRSFFDQLLNA
jgi:hypothetical protein